MLDSKDLEILEALKENLDQPFKKIKNFLNHIKISRGDFYYHLNHINSALKHKNKTLNVTKITKEEFQEIYELITSKQDIFLNSNVGGYILVTYVFLNDYTKLSTISKLLNISVNSAFKLITKINETIREKYHYDKILISNSGNGYFFCGDELSKRKLLINLSIQINTNKSSKLILDFIFNKFNLPYGYEDFLKIKNILLSHKNDLSFVELGWDTLSLILFITLVYREKFSEGQQLYAQLADHEQFYKHQKSYNIASQVIDEICTTFNVEFTSNQFEKLFLSNMFLSKHEMIVATNDFGYEYQVITNFLQRLFDHLEKEGYTINRHDAQQRLFRFLIWTKYQWENLWTIDATTKLKQDFINSRVEYKTLFKFLTTNLNKNIKEVINKELIEKQIIEFTIIFIPYINTFPQKDVIRQEAILVTDLKGSLANLLKAKATEMFPNFYINKIISLNNYYKNKNHYDYYLKISNDVNIEKENKGIYFSLNTNLEDMLAKIKLESLAIEDLLDFEKAKMIVNKILESDATSEEKVQVLLQLFYLAKK
ncbi:hypothetical protein [Spiroplasma eriocheiris]|uniref:Mga helix-turn-helix domain-containing protein n=1 Tax=Spiroplasma eriocheiris TaxID=315358 RepID=A0A0H3XJN2_9MOLU|nr:hypothetical protein [Spiroplasma eriocheiris]AHF57613.1 hypothetical protein SPE_0485 [Spiroplasma eriocheiris CCTCC M 207170]AKM54066.1 hypothetical protein SERIO_v1c04910 [Spiroplasma eriocheiris]